ncbi:NUDIX hydrolase [Streptomyces sp. NPDC001315]|uniref:NUDIX hydrolase n=1 Tax=Streptomyces sp. NPDC001315 TaxID=3364562 RepID=UPI0036D02B96
MTSSHSRPSIGDERLRTQLVEMVERIDPWDELERTHLETATEWVASGAPVCRTRKPDVPAMHLVSYFVVLDEECGVLLLVAHRKAGLWLPTGGHVEPGETPWSAVERECLEELGIPAAASTITGRRPFFLTVTRTRGQGEHTDVSLWYVVSAAVDSIVSYDEEEFTAIRWLTPEQVLGEPLNSLDPHMHRFTRKLAHAAGLDTAAPTARRSP